MIVFLLLKIRVLITLNNSVNFILLIDSVPKSSIIKRSELNILSKKSLEILFFPNLQSIILSSIIGAVWYKTIFPLSINSLAMQLERNVLPSPGLPVNNKFFPLGLSKSAKKLSTIFFIINMFCLGETEEYFKSRGFLWSRLGILHTYMAVGGVPYYLSLFNIGESSAQGIDRLFFSENGEFQKEYHRLFGSLFRNPDPYLKIIDLLAAKPQGLTRDEISRKLNTDNNGRLGNILNDLIYCDFIRYNPVRDKKIKANSGIYVLADFYTLFYHSFLKKTTTKAIHYWTQMQGTPIVNTWLGLAYERVVMAHIANVKKALGIESVLTESYSWRTKDDTAPAVQIDLLIERADKMINLCEIKYSETEYNLTKEEYLIIGRRVDAFKQATLTRYCIVATMFTTFGLTLVM